MMRRVMVVVVILIMMMFVGDWNSWVGSDLMGNTLL